MSRGVAHNMRAQCKELARTTFFALRSLLCMFMWYVIHRIRSLSLLLLLCSSANARAHLRQRHSGRVRKLCKWQAGATAANGGFVAVVLITPYKTRQDKRGQDKRGQDEQRQTKTRDSKTGEDKRRQDKRRQDKRRQEKTKIWYEALPHSDAVFVLPCHVLCCFALYFSAASLTLRGWACRSQPWPGIYAGTPGSWDWGGEAWGRSLF